MVFADNPKGGDEMSHYHHLTIEERETLYLMHGQGKNNSEIARELGRSRSTISRELRRNRKKRDEYSPSQAERYYRKRRKNCGRNCTGRRSRSKNVSGWNSIHCRSVTLPYTAPSTQDCLDGSPAWEESSASPIICAARESGPGSTEKRSVKGNTGRNIPYMTGPQAPTSARRSDILRGIP